MRVRAKSSYYYNPVAMDRFDPKTPCVRGDKVRVVKLYGCPPPNTMNHCHIETLSGELLGLVHCNSLQKEPVDA